MISGERGKHKRDTWKQKVNYIMLHILWRLGSGVLDFSLGLGASHKKIRYLGYAFTVSHSYAPGSSCTTLQLQPLSDRNPHMHASSFGYLSTGVCSVTSHVCASRFLS